MSWKPIEDYPLSPVLGSIGPKCLFYLKGVRESSAMSAVGIRVPGGGVMFFCNGGVISPTYFMDHPEEPK